MVDADMPSPEAVCDVRLDLDLDMSNSTSVKFSYPTWSENDALSRELTDSILTENFLSAAERQLCYDTSITNEHLLNDASSATVASDLAWNTFQGIEQFYYGDNKDFDNANTGAMLDNTDISDLLIFQVDSLIDSNASKNTNENIFETNTDPLSDVYSSDEAFELDLFDECLKDVDTIVSSQGFNTASDHDSFSAGVSTSVIMPLFGNNFTPKKVPGRRPTELSRDRESLTEKDLVNDNNIIKVKIGDGETKFEDGHWHSGKGSIDNKSNEYDALRKRVKILKEQNNILHLRLDILTDMLARTKFEQHVQLQENEQLRKETMKQIKREHKSKR
ncbi:Chibby [Carabus blaptoides fortunei]